MKRIRNWKTVPGYLDCDLNFALNCLKEQKLDGENKGPFAIKCNRTGKQYDSWNSEMSFSALECLSLWEILVPDNEKEERNEKVRDLMKESNCSGLTYDKIDNMSLMDIWSYIHQNLTENQIYKMILLYYDLKVYKNNN